MSDNHPLPKPIFDSFQSHPDQDWPVPDYIEDQDYRLAYQFLKAYDGSEDTFNTYRREVDKLLQWLALVIQKSLKFVDRDDIESYINFCKKPPQNWIGTKVVSRFILKNGEKIPNPDWKPFVVKISKSDHKNDQTPLTKKYKLSDATIQAILRNLSTFFSFLEQEDYIDRNPVKRIRQRSKFTRKKAVPSPVRRLSELQWDYVIETAEMMADCEPSNERTLFIMSMLYGLYLRISELVESDRWLPSMNHFFQDDDGNWWFKTVGKGNKERDITVSGDVLKALKRYRQFLGLTALPYSAENAPLLPKYKGQGGISSTKNIRLIVQKCFDQAVNRMREDGFADESEQLQSATVHWLRHTGISDDVRRRPKEHVRDDAGHSSSVTTDRYIDIERRERHVTGKNREMRPINAS